VNRRAANLAGGRVRAAGDVHAHHRRIGVLDHRYRFRYGAPRLAAETGAEQGIDDHRAVGERLRGILEPDRRRPRQAIEVCARVAGYL
jgi:hypothetical protein